MNLRLLGGLGAALAVLLVLGVCRSRLGPASGEETEASPVVGVQVAPIVRATLREYVDTWGSVEPAPVSGQRRPASARVAAPVAGLVSEVRCAEGERVSEGSVLFRLDGRVADVAVAKARQALPFAEAAFERQKALGPGEATSQRQYQEAEQALAAARNDLANAEALRALLDVRAPLAGTVVKVNARPGDAVDPTTLLAEVIDLDRLVVSAVVRSSEVGRVRPGQAVELTVSGSASAKDPAAIAVHGTVAFVGAQVDSRTDSVAIRGSVPAGAGLRPGQLLTVRICTAEHKDRLAVPVEALVTEAGAPAIAVVDGDRAVKRPVKPGLRDGPLVEVEGEGLREGLTVVSAGAYGLPSQSRIRVLER
jgi:membrane fusion protein, multidrug efflux system